MSMHSHVVGFCPPDEDYKKKAAAWRACKAAGIEPPRDLMRLFDGNEPQDAGMQVDIAAAVSKYEDGMQEGFDVDISKLPAGVRVVRFYNSW